MPWWKSLSEFAEIEVAAEVAVAEIAGGAAMTVVADTVSKGDPKGKVMQRDVFR